MRDPLRHVYPTDLRTYLRFPSAIDARLGEILWRLFTGESPLLSSFHRLMGECVAMETRDPEEYSRGLRKLSPIIRKIK